MATNLDKYSFPTDWLKNWAETNDIFSRTDELSVTFRMLVMIRTNIWDQLDTKQRDALDQTIDLVQTEVDYYLDPEFESDYWFESRMNLIPLKEWAERVGIDPATARQKASRGKLPAVKLGRDWMINRYTENTDHRKKPE